MTTERQRASNAANARRSTGPRTGEGRARSSGNARRHGLTGPVPGEDLGTWYRVILDVAGAAPDPFDPDPVRHAAFRLAAAEAHLARVREAEDTLRSELLSWLDRTEAELGAVKETVVVRQTGTRLNHEITRTAHWQSCEAAPDDDGRRRRLRVLARYRAEAEAQRRKALRRFLQARSPESRNEANCA